MRLLGEKIDFLLYRMTEEWPWLSEINLCIEIGGDFVGEFYFHSGRF